jgi:hypothetical protein
MPLQQLETLQFGVDFRELAPLLRLAQLPALQQLRLEVNCWCDAAALAPAWGEMPQLSQLMLFNNGDAYNAQQAEAGVGGLVAATSLTNLRVEFPGISYQQEAAAAALNEEGGQQQGPINACASIAGLTRLNHLDLFYLANLLPPSSVGLAAALVPGDVVALTALTGLTYLRLEACGACVGDMDVATLACCLEQLRHLCLDYCDLGDMACLGAIAHLPQLTELSLQGIPGLTWEGLMLLTRLSHLQQLRVDTNSEVTDAVMAEFWAAVRGSRQR